MDAPPLEQLAVTNLVIFSANLHKPKFYYRGNKCAPKRETPSLRLAKPVAMKQITTLLSRLVGLYRGPFPSLSSQTHIFPTPQLYACYAPSSAHFYFVITAMFGKNYA